MATDLKPYGLIDEPPLYGSTLAMWEQFLARAEALPDDDVLKAPSVAKAREMITLKRHEQATLTPSEQESLRQEANETADFAQKAFAHLRPKDG